MAYGITLISYVQAEIYVFYAWRWPSWIYDFRLVQTVSKIALLERPKKHASNSGAEVLRSSVSAYSGNK